MGDYWPEPCPDKVYPKETTVTDKLKQLQAELESCKSLAEKYGSDEMQRVCDKIQKAIDEEKERIATTDFGAAQTMMNHIITQYIGARDRLLDIRNANQNKETGDGSFTSNEWYRLKHFIKHMEDARCVLSGTTLSHSSRPAPSFQGRRK